MRPCSSTRSEPRAQATRRATRLRRRLERSAAGQRAQARQSGRLRVHGRRRSLRCPGMIEVKLNRQRLSARALRRRLRVPRVRRRPGTATRWPARSNSTSNDAWTSTPLTTSSSSTPSSLLRASNSGQPPAGTSGRSPRPCRSAPATASRRHAVAIQQAVTNARSSSLRIRSPTSGRPPASLTRRGLPVDVAEEHRRVRLDVVVHEHQLLAELVLEVPQIAPRPLLDQRRRRRMMIGQPHQLVLMHAANNDRYRGGNQNRNTSSRYPASSAGPKPRRHPPSHPQPPPASVSREPSAARATCRATRR